MCGGCKLLFLSFKPLHPCGCPNGTNKGRCGHDDYKIKFSFWFSAPTSSCSCVLLGCDRQQQTS